MLLRTIADSQFRGARAFPDSRFVIDKFLRLAAVSHATVEKLIENEGD